MNEVRVESTTLRRLRTTTAAEILQLEFRSQAVYSYYGVPAAVYEALLAAPSKGQLLQPGDSRAFSAMAVCRKCASRLAG